MLVRILAAMVGLFLLDLLWLLLLAPLLGLDYFGTAGWHAHEPSIAQCCLLQLSACALCLLDRSHRNQ